jgi:hypothetical protein
VACDMYRGQSGTCSRSYRLESLVFPSLRLAIPAISPEAHQSLIETYQGKPPNTSTSQV